MFCSSGCCSQLRHVHALQPVSFLMAGAIITTDLLLCWRITISSYASCSELLTYFISKLPARKRSKPWYFKRALSRLLSLSLLPVNLSAHMR